MRIFSNGVEVYGPAAEAGGLQGATGLKSTLAKGVGLARPGGGSAAFLDIHYHGSSAADVATQPATGKLGIPGGSAAFLDIHYHGSSAADLARPGMEAGGLQANLPRAAMPVGAGAKLPGGSAAFLDIHYHGSSAADIATRNPAGKLGSPGGSAAFLDIHYHGSSAADIATKGNLGSPGGSAAFLDIHYHGSSAGDLARPGMESGQVTDQGEDGAQPSGEIHIYGP